MNLISKTLLIKKQKGELRTYLIGFIKMKAQFVLFVPLFVIVASINLNCTEEKSLPIDQTAEEVLQRALDNYKSLKTYQDKVTMHAVSNIPGVEDVKNEDIYEFKFAQPKQFALTSFDGHSIYSDGKTITAHLIHSGKYTNNDFSKESDWKKLSGFAGKLVAVLHPVAEIFINEKNDNSSFPTVTKIISVIPEKYEGESGKTVNVEADYSAMGFSSPVKVSLWFSDKTGFLRRVFADMTVNVEKMVKKPVKTNYIELIFNDIVTDSPVAEKEFSFVPRKVDQKVSDFLAIDQKSKDDGTFRYLIDRPAPEVDAFDLNGKPIKLSDYRGKVVLLEFWATWCGACARSMEHLKEIVKSFDDKDNVVILGVNMDDPGDDANVKKYLESRDLTFRNFRDAESKISSAFRVLATPTLAVIDQNGVVKTIHSGQGSDMVERYTKLINTLLKQNS